MPMRDDNSIYSESYGITNIKLGWLRNLGSFDLDVYGGIQNLFDVKYASMILVNAPSFGGRPPRYYYPGLPINYYAGLSVSYSFNQGL
jgi:iron complex outermembrane receptor protein